MMFLSVVVTDSGRGSVSSETRSECCYQECGEGMHSIKTYLSFGSGLSAHAELGPLDQRFSQPKGILAQAYISLRLKFDISHEIASLQAM